MLSKQAIVEMSAGFLLSIVIIVGLIIDGVAYWTANTELQLVSLSMMFIAGGIGMLWLLLMCSYNLIVSYRELH
jgi:hypothetical protein